MSIRRNTYDNSKQVGGQKALERAETIAKLARKLKYLATTGRIG
jgi:hypothetical protein